MMILVIISNNQLKNISTKVTKQFKLSTREKKIHSWVKINKVFQSLQFKK